MSETERPQKEFTTPSGHSVIVKEYLTGRETREIENVYIESVNGVVDPESPRPKLTGEIANKAQDKLFTVAIVSINGNGAVDNIVESLLAMKSVDYDFVVKLVNEVSKGVGFSVAEKKTS